MIWTFPEEGQRIQWTKHVEYETGRQEEQRKTSEDVVKECMQRVGVTGHDAGIGCRQMIRCDVDNIHMLYGLCVVICSTCISAGM